MDPIGTKTSGQSLPKGLKSEQMLPLCMGTGDLQLECSPSIPTCRVLSSRALTLSPEDKGLSLSQCTWSLFGRMGHCVTDEELPTPSSTPQPPEQSFLTVHEQWEVVGLMVGGTQVPKIPVWCNTLLMGGTSE